MVSTTQRGVQQLRCLPSLLLQQIDEAASARGMDRSNWIRSVCIEAAARPSTDRDLVNRVNVIDERAREVMVDVIERVARLEAAVFKQKNHDVLQRRGIFTENISFLSFFGHPSRLLLCLPIVPQKS